MIHLNKKALAWVFTVFLLSIVGSGTLGIISSGNGIVGAIPVAVTQAVRLQKPLVPTDPDEVAITQVSPDNLRFTVTITVGKDREFDILVPIVNVGSKDIVTELTLTIPEKIKPKDVETTGSGVIDDVVRPADNTWKFTVDSGAAGFAKTPFDGVRIHVRAKGWAKGTTLHFKGEIKPGVFDG